MGEHNPEGDLAKIESLKATMTEVLDRSTKLYSQTPAFAQHGLVAVEAAKAIADLVRLQRDLNGVGVTPKP
jgi:hypothetical protein